MIWPATPTGSRIVKLSALAGTGLTWPVTFVRQASIIFKTGGDVCDVVFGFDDRFAGVAAFKFRKRSGVLPNLFRQLE